MTEVEDTDPTRPLVLRSDILSKVGGLFDAMKDAPDLQTEFIENPSAAIYAHVTGETLPEQRASISNQLLFSILGNEKLVAWLRGYAAGRDDDPPGRDAFMADFSRAIVTHGGDSAVLALIRSTLARETPLGFGDDLAFVISSSPVAASGVVVSTDQKQSQSQSQNQDQRAAQDLRSSQNFEQSTRQDARATTSQIYDFDLEIYNSIHVRATVEALVAHAARLHENGLLNRLDGRLQR